MAKKEESFEWALTCPFCNGESLRIFDVDDEAWISCEDCGARGPSCLDSDKDSGERRLDAISSWNAAIPDRHLARKFVT